MLRLSPHPFSSLPPHESLQLAESRPDLEDFLHSILSEAQTFTTQTIPQTFAADPKLRASPPSTAKVQLLISSRNNNKNKNKNNNNNNGNDKNNDGEYWVCRKSTHADAAQKGTASWAEFVKGLRENHSENEMAYTPSVASVEHLVQWPVQKEVRGGWRDVDMHGNFCLSYLSLKR